MQKSFVQTSLNEESAKIAAGEEVDTGGDSLFVKLQIELSRFDEEIEHRQARILFLKNQIVECGIKRESVDGGRGGGGTEEKDLVEEEDETDFTADELVERVAKIRASRNAFAEELRKASAVKQRMDKLMGVRKNQLEQVEEMIRTGISKRLLLGNRRLADFSEV
jgi:CO dehydrogenase/acetyl-CoA synthase alpha subunit